MTATVDRDRVLELYRDEKAAYTEYVGEQRGDQIRPSDLRGRVISPVRVRAAKERWEQAVSALRAAGGTPDLIRELLQGESAN